MNIIYILMKLKLSPNYIILKMITKAHWNRV